MLEVTSSPNAIPQQRLPASLVLGNVLDPAENWEGAPPRFGQQFLPHIFTATGRYGVAARAYSTGDEALMHSCDW